MAGSIVRVSPREWLVATWQHIGLRGMLYPAASAVIGFLVAMIIAPEAVLEGAFEWQTALYATALVAVPWLIGAIHRGKVQVLEEKLLRATAAQVDTPPSLPSLDQVREWKRFIEAYKFAADGPFEHVNLVYEPEYVEMRPHLTEETRNRIDHLTGMGLKLSLSQPTREIARLIVRDLTVVERAIGRDEWGDEHGYLQIPRRLQ